MACKEVSRDAAGVAAPDNPGWIQLFNGRDLQGWQVKIRGHQMGNNFKNTFLVEDGILKVSYDQYDTVLWGSRSRKVRAGPFATMALCFTASQLPAWGWIRISQYPWKPNYWVGVSQGNAPR